MTMPPRHGKSETCSHFTPLWFLELFPHLFVIEAGYGSDFASEWGRRVRDSVTRWGQDGTGDLLVSLRQDTKAAGLWHTEQGGGMFSTGVGGPMTGRGGHLILIDDPIKNEEEANSEVYREKVWNWWLSVVRTRFEPGCTVIVIQTRWHEDDLAGRLLAQETSEDWRLVNLPALAEENDPLGRAEGDPLWPYRFSTPEWEAAHPGQEHQMNRGKPEWEDLHVLRQSVTEYWWQAMFQGNPRPPGGSVFRRSDFRYAEDGGEWWALETDAGLRRVLKKSCWYFQTVDAALKDKTHHDWSVVSTWAVTARHELILVDVYRDRLEVPDQWPTFKRIRLATSYPLSFQGVEDRAGGTTVIQMAKRDGLPCKPLEPVGDKIDRATPMAVFYENHSVYHLRAPWLSVWEHELESFPNGKWDDQVDTASYAGRVLLDIRSGRMPLELQDDPVAVEEDTDRETGTMLDRINLSPHRSGLDDYLREKARRIGL